MIPWNFVFLSFEVCKEEEEEEEKEEATAKNNPDSEISFFNKKIVENKRDWVSL